MEKKKHIDLVPRAFRRGVLSREEVNEYRRGLLKLFLVGTGGFVLGKFFNPIVRAIKGERDIALDDIKNFKFVEKGRELHILDDDGEELFIIDKDTLS